MQIYIFVSSIELVKIHKSKPQIYHASSQMIDLKSRYRYFFTFFVVRSKYLKNMIFFILIYNDVLDNIGKN